MTGHDYVSLTGRRRESEAVQEPRAHLPDTHPVTIIADTFIMEAEHSLIRRCGSQVWVLWRTGQALITAWGQGAKQKPETLLSALRTPSSNLPTSRGGNPEQAVWQAFSKCS